MRGSRVFCQEGLAFSRGVQMLISIETHITCDFPIGDPYPTPLDPHMKLTATVKKELCKSGNFLKINKIDLIWQALSMKVNQIGPFN